MSRVLDPSDEQIGFEVDETEEDELAELEAEIAELEALEDDE